NEIHQTLDVGGHDMAASRKFRNLAANETIAIVFDDIASVEPWRVRCLEIRGRGDARPDHPDPPPPHHQLGHRSAGPEPGPPQRQVVGWVRPDQALYRSLCGD